MKTNKRIVIIISSVVILVVSGWALFWFLPIHRETMEVIKSWQGFCMLISEGRITEAEQKYIDSEDTKYYPHMEGYLKFESDKVTYCGADITEKLPKWRCKYVATFDCERKRHDEYEKVIFETGYTLLRNGKIVYVKIP